MPTDMPNERDQKDNYNNTEVINMDIEHDDIYFNEIAEDYADNDEISAAEEGFMMGYLEAV